MTDSSSSKPSYQPTSRPSELWVAPSVPADITSDLLTSQPTNNAVGTLPLSVKDTIKLDDESTLAWDHYVFIGIIVAVIVLLIVYFNRRYG